MESPHSPRHCEEHLRRSNPDCLCGKILDCFATLAMTAEQNKSAGAVARSGASFVEAIELTPR
nr:hypothetical protein FNV92_22740 [Bradyrhizobium cosmicum]